jgi:hypothetical protein
VKAFSENEPSLDVFTGKAKPPFRDFRFSPLRVPDLCGVIPPAVNIWIVMARSEATKPPSWIATARFAHLLMNSYGLSLRARLGGRGNPAEISDG